jgi:hypothetical protein
MGEPLFLTPILLPMSYAAAIVACVVFVFDCSQIIRDMRKILVLVAIFSAWFLLSYLPFLPFLNYVFVVNMVAIVFTPDHMLYGVALPVTTVLNLAVGMTAALIAERKGWGTSWRFSILLLLAIAARLSHFEITDSALGEVTLVEKGFEEEDAVWRVLPAFYAALGIGVFSCLSMVKRKLETLISSVFFGRSVQAQS